MKQDRAILPGLLVLHGNRMEDLCDLAVYCLDRSPLRALEEEILLVSSHGAGEWLKMSSAQRRGIFAATRIQLPARFQWHLYRQVLGHDSLPTSAPLDRDALLWRLMHCLPQLATDARFESVLGRLRGSGSPLWFQWARRLADLYDQYQVYRMDWLESWAGGSLRITNGSGMHVPLPESQRWQAVLWQELVASLGPDQRDQIRPAVHRRVMERLQTAGACEGRLPRRVTVFGASTLAPAILELLVALAQQAQVIVAVPNPCQYHWADIMEGRELLAGWRRRQPLRQGRDLAALPLQQMHEVAHPLLAAWGRQGRDFMRLLDRFDEAAQASERFSIPRTDVFSEGRGSTLLEQVQAAIRDLLPLQEHPAAREAAHTLSPQDRSIQFHVAYSPLREVEILHDQLLDLLAQSRERPVQPRDIIVMVPQIDPWIPRINAVFGQYAPQDPRHIPFTIADQPLRPEAPLFTALQWFLNIDSQRITQGELQTLLEVPAIAARAAIDPEERAQLSAWVSGAGVRWGLHQEHRAQWGLQACGEAFTWRHGLERMVLGFASGHGEAFAGIEPYEDIGGLEAGGVGVLAVLLDRLDQWWRLAQQPAPPGIWAERARTVLAQWVCPQDVEDRMLLAQMHEALDNWLETCAVAAFDDAVPLAVFREAWLERLDEVRQGGGRFLTGGVTFCTLMPLRAIPFQVVCLVGMNERDYPRQTRVDDFDLMALAGQYRPGDRSRREDDRYLMLEALLSARQVLSVSWTGRSVQDGSPCPPSVLVSQLRDYLAAGWRAPGQELNSGQRDDLLLQQRTTEHPMQPFSRRYFEGQGMHTYATEWRAAHDPPSVASGSGLSPAETLPQVSLQQLTGFLRNPVKTFFQRRLGVQFDQAPEEDLNEELMELDGLQRHQVLQRLLDYAVQDPQAPAQATVARGLARLFASARLPLGGYGRYAQEVLQDSALNIVRWWHHYTAPAHEPLGQQRLSAHHEGIELADWLIGLRGTPPAYQRVDMTASFLVQGGHAHPEVRPHALLAPWLTLNAAAAQGIDLSFILVGADVVLALPAPNPEAARAYLRAVLNAWRLGQEDPLPWALRTALAWCAQRSPRQDYEGGWRHGGEREEPCLARLFPDFDTLRQDGRFDHYARVLFQPLWHWAQTDVEVLHQVSDAQPTAGMPHG